MKIKTILIVVVSFALGAVAGWCVGAGVLGHADVPPMQCMGGADTDEHGCCPGETYTDMGKLGFNCCPNGGGDCFPPMKK